MDHHPINDGDDREDGISGIIEVQGTIVPHRDAEDDDPSWLLHETQLLRQPVYRTERADAEDDPPGSYFDNPAADQLPLLTYEYDPQTTVITRRRKPLPDLRIS